MFSLSHSVVSDTAESLWPYEAEQIATGAATCFFPTIICCRSGTSLTSLTAETSPPLVFMSVSHLESRCSGGISGAQVAPAAPGSQPVGWLEVGGGHILTAQMGLQVANT